MIDLAKLNEGLNNLRGLDFELAEAQERAAGNNFPEVSFSKSFQARLAALALNVPVADIKELPVRQFMEVCGATFNFIYGTSADATQSAKSEVSPST